MLKITNYSHFIIIIQTAEAAFLKTVNFLSYLEIGDRF